jgi:TrmH family RNA methyltransferase
VTRSSGPGVIDEPSHPRVRAARRCHSASGRARTGRFLAEGAQAVREAVAEPGVVVEIFATPQWRSGDASDSAAAILGNAVGVPIHEVSERVLASIAETTTPQGVVAVCRDVTVGLDVLLARSPRLVVVLAEVRDPGNAGTIIRTADAAGADGVVLTTASVDPLGGKCVRSSVGSVFHLPLVVGQPVEVVDHLRGAGLTVLAADADADLDITEADEQGLLARPTAWVVGNEAHGVPVPYLRAVDAVVGVPVHGRAESLNVSVAAGVCLYASARAQRRPRREPH